MSEIGRIETPRYALDLKVENSLIYVNSEGAWIGFNVTDPKNPAKVTSLPDSFSDKTELGRYRVINLIFLTDNTTLRILDLSGSEQAVEIGRCALRPKSSIQGPGEIFVAGDRAYIVVEAGVYEYHLCIVDISDTAEPAVMGTCGISRSVHKHISKIHVYQDCAYVAISFGGLFIVDVSNPMAPRITGSFKTSSNF